MSDLLNCLNRDMLRCLNQVVERARRPGAAPPGPIPEDLFSPSLNDRIDELRIAVAEACSPWFEEQR